MHLEGKRRLAYGFRAALADRPPLYFYTICTSPPKNGLGRGKRVTPYIWFDNAPVTHGMVAVAIEPASALERALVYGSVIGSPLPYRPLGAHSGSWPASSFRTFPAAVDVNFRA